jgi:hypothetical protein
MEEYPSKKIRLMSSSSHEEEEDELQRAAAASSSTTDSSASPEDSFFDQVDCGGLDDITVQEIFDCIGEENTKNKFVPCNDGACLYNGILSKGLPHVSGTLVAANLEWIYEGGFKHGLRHGNGVLKMKNGYFYEGEWEDNVQHGFGCAVIPTKAGPFCHRGLWTKAQTTEALIAPYRVIRPLR